MDDLATLLAQENNENDEGRATVKVDLSSRPVPKNVRAILNSGIEIPCELTYDGRAADDVRIRRYLVKAEVNWTRHWVKTLVVGEFPIDVRFILDMPEALPSDALQFRHQLQVIPEKQV